MAMFLLRPPGEEKTAENVQFEPDIYIPMSHKTRVTSIYPTSRCESCGAKDFKFDKTIGAYRCEYCQSVIPVRC